MNKKVMGMVVTSIVAISSATLIPGIAHQEKHRENKGTDVQVEEQLVNENSKSESHESVNVDKEFLKEDELKGSLSIQSQSKSMKKYNHSRVKAINNKTQEEVKEKSEEKRKKENTGKSKKYTTKKDREQIKEVVDKNNREQTKEVVNKTDREQTKEVVNKTDREKTKEVVNKTDREKTKKVVDKTDREKTKEKVNKTESIVNLNKSKIVKVEETGYAVIALSKGSIDNTKFKINSHNINPSKVNSEGTIVKFQVNPSEIAKIKVIQGKNIEKIVLNPNGKKFTRVIENEAPDKILVSGPISKFDYHQTNYDKQGNTRIKPNKTTFSTSKYIETYDETLPKLNIEKTKIGNDVVINIIDNSKEARKWKNHIYSIEVVDEHNPNLVSKLQYSLQNGKIVINKNSSAINQRNGIHNIRIKSKGYNDLNTKIEIMNPSGKILLSGDYNFYAKNELLFELENFNYGAINPIYEVVLDGNVLEGNCKDYHIVSNLVRLENNCIEKLTKGRHELIIKAHGYEDFKRIFSLEDAPDSLQNPSMGKGEKSEIIKHKGNKKDVDVIGSASVKKEHKKDVDAIGSASVKKEHKKDVDVIGSASGGSVNMRGNIVYDFDLLSNAMILKNLGMETKESSEVLSWWHAMTKDAILTNESQKVIDYKKYKNAVNEANMNGSYLTFKDYYNSIKESDYLNRPYQVKYILEDGLFGEAQLYSQENLKITPNVNVTKSKEKIYIDIDNDTQYLNNIEKLWANMNILSQDSYKIKGNRIIINDLSKLSYGDNIIKIQSKGYKELSIKINTSKSLPDLDLSKDENENIVLKLDKNYKDNIQSIILNGKTLLNDLQVGNSNGDYEFKGDCLIIRNKLFDKKVSKQYTLVIKANGYKELNKMFNINKVNTKEVDKIDVPKYVKLNDNNSYKPNDKVLVDVEKVFNNEYRKSITSVLLDGKEIKYNNSNKDFYSIEIAKDEFKKEGLYKLTIKAKGYKDFETTIKISNKENQKDGVNIEKEEVPNITSKADIFNKIIFTSNDKEYIKSISKVILDNKELKISKSAYENEGYNISDDKLTILSSLQSGSKIKFESSKYKDYVYVAPKKSVDKVSVSKNSNGGYTISNKDYSWTDSIEIFVNGDKLEDDFSAENGSVNISKSLNSGDKVVIKSKGYEDFSYKVSLIKANINVQKNDVITKSYSFNTNDYNWKENINSVKINGVEINKTNEFTPSEGYKINYSGGIDIYNTLNSGDKITINSDGYEVFSYTI